MVRGSARAACIAALNDHLRQTFSGGLVMLTKGIRALDDEQQKRVLLAVQQFNSFTVDNDPWGERDCAPLTVDGINVIWKIDYYEDGSLTMGADDPMAPQTVRVLTVMLAEEY